jgi:hypothetical protein
MATIKALTWCVDSEHMATEMESVAATAVCSQKGGMYSTSPAGGRRSCDESSPGEAEQPTYALHAEDVQL